MGEIHRRKLCSYARVRRCTNLRQLAPPPTPTKCDDFTNYGNGPDAGPLVKLSKAYFHYICTLCTLQYGSLFKLTLFFCSFSSTGRWLAHSLCSALLGFDLDLEGGGVCWLGRRWPKTGRGQEQEQEPSHLPALRESRKDPSSCHTHNPDS